jgi:hypothetical protein
MQPKLVGLVLVAATAMDLFQVTSAKAEFVISIQQVGLNVIATGNGTINIAGLTKTGIYRGADYIQVGGKFAGYGTGVPGQPVTVFNAFSGLSGPSSFGSGNTTNANTPFSGDSLILSGHDGTLDLPMDYVSGSPLANADIFLNKTLAGLGLTAGTYTYTFGAGSNADSIVVQIGPVAPPPVSLATKICAPYVLNAWRTVTPVPSTWTLEDCRNMAQTIGATTLQVGCFFDRAPTSQPQKYSFGGSGSLASPPTASNAPSPNCGW